MGMNVCGPHHHGMYGAMSYARMSGAVADALQSLTADANGASSAAVTTSTASARTGNRPMRMEGDFPRAGHMQRADRAGDDATRSWMRALARTFADMFGNASALTDATSVEDADVVSTTPAVVDANAPTSSAPSATAAAVATASLPVATTTTDTAPVTTTAPTVAQPAPPTVTPTAAPAETAPQMTTVTTTTILPNGLKIVTTITTPIDAPKNSASPAAGGSAAPAATAAPAAAATTPAVTNFTPALTPEEMAAESQAQAAPTSTPATPTPSSKTTTPATDPVVTTTVSATETTPAATTVTDTKTADAVKADDTAAQTAADAAGKSAAKGYSRRVFHSFMHDLFKAIKSTGEEARGDGDAVEKSGKGDKARAAYGSPADAIRRLIQRLDSNDPAVASDPTLKRLTADFQRLAAQLTGKTVQPTTGATAASSTSAAAPATQTSTTTTTVEQGPAAGTTVTTSVTTPTGAAASTDAAAGTGAPNAVSLKAFLEKLAANLASETESPMLRRKGGLVSTTA